MPEMSHVEMADALQRAARAVAPQDVAGHFLATLGKTGGNDGTLRSWAYALNFPAHPFQESPGAERPGGAKGQCVICGLAPVEEAVQALTDLEAFAKHRIAEPTIEDVARFDRMLGALAELPPDARASDLDRAWKGLVPKSNRYSRAALVETLGACSILRTVDHPGHFTRWIGFWETNERPTLKGELPPPAGFWTRSDGIGREALDLLFPQEGIGRDRFPRDRGPEREADPVPVTLPQSKKAKRPALELAPRDLVGIEQYGRWLLGVVLGRHRGPDGECPVVEFFAGSVEALPDSVELLRDRSARAVGPYRDGPTWRREPLALHGLELFGSTWSERVERVARGVPPPQGRDLGPAPNGYRVVLARNTLYALKAVQAQSGRAS